MMEIAQRLERCHKLALGASTFLDALDDELPHEPPDGSHDEDASLPAQLARLTEHVGGVLDAPR